MTLLRRARDWVMTIPLLISLGITLVAFDVAGRIVRPFSLPKFEALMASLSRTLVRLFRISGTRLEVERSPLIETDRGYAIISNHQSLFDIALIGGLLDTNHPKYVAKKELSRWIPSVSLNLRRGGNALIDRNDRIGSVRSIKNTAKTAQERDVSVVIFPEGTRSRDGSLQRFHASGVRALLGSASRLEVVPVAIDGSWRLLARNLLPVPFGTRVKVKLGAPIGRRSGDAAEIAERAEAWIAESLAGWRRHQRVEA